MELEQCGCRCTVVGGWRGRTRREGEEREGGGGGRGDGALQQLPALEADFNGGTTDPSLEIWRGGSSEGAGAAGQR